MTDSAAPEVTLANWQSAPQLRWAFQNLAEVLPTANICHGDGPVAELPSAPAELSSITLQDPVPGTERTVADVMASTDTDGWIVTHHGKVLEERYFGDMTAQTVHLLMSVSKSLVGTVAGALADAGLLDVEAELTRYVPPLAQSGYAGATVRHILDMRSGIRFSEDYLDPMAEVRLIEQAIDWAPRTVPDLPTTMYDFLVTLQQEVPHGGPFRYRSCETDVLGWVCEAAAGEPMPQLMSRLLWSRIGAQQDAVIGVDGAGTGMFDGGINASLRDLVRFGWVYARDGVSLTGAQVVSPAWVTDTLVGGPDSRAAFEPAVAVNRMPGGMYRNQFWSPRPGGEVLLCLGIHGQMIYINRAADMVAAKLSSWPLPEEPAKLVPTIAAFDAIADQLR
ncbi:serine hydrolase domain-containing protein [Mycolicibacterium confluentis]|uniref:Hydrolase n=1 Tax=Mycolicibacterium confluentis TaxID=28047 RepID=A0A7I7Y3W0_9MYCO|nr:serine hydrolase [Mycolicibacterium confluentis]ORV31208.1 hydrolase [Mycolicibacterium confluentis]BBZ36024.1 hydrolase [Mycolicibacterium confluentis]